MERVSPCLEPEGIQLEGRQHVGSRAGDPAVICACSERALFQIEQQRIAENAWNSVSPSTNRFAQVWSVFWGRQAIGLSERVEVFPDNHFHFAMPAKSTLVL